MFTNESATRSIYRINDPRLRTLRFREGADKQRITGNAMIPENKQAQATIFPSTWFVSRRQRKG